MAKTKKSVYLHPPGGYAESFRRMVVAEFERGGATKDALQEKYGIRGNSTLLKWCRLYGKLDYTSKKGSQTGRPLMDPQQRRIKELEQQLAQAKTALKKAELKEKAYEKLLDVIERNHGIDIKKTDAKQ